jgi:PBP superfamily domain
MFFSTDSPISLVYNLPELPSNCTDYTNIGKSCLMLSQEMVVGIFNGTIRKWNDPLLLTQNSALASVNETIIVVVRGDGSGTTGIFTRVLSAFNTNWNTGQSQYFTDGDFQFKKFLFINIQFPHVNSGHFFYQLRYTVAFYLNSMYISNQLKCLCE